MSQTTKESSITTWLGLGLALGLGVGVANHLNVAGSRGAGALALPLDEEPRHWDAAEVTWDPAARTLSRTER